MQTILRTLLLIDSLIVSISVSSAADVSAIWDGGNGNWGDFVHWSSNPDYPNNSGSLTYDATINSGTVTLDRNITIQRLFFNDGNLSGPFELTVNDGLVWTGGTIGPSTINLAAGSTSTFDTPNFHQFYGTLNNFGTVNDNAVLPYFGGIINNAVGATWRMPFGMNPIAGMLTGPASGHFNNAGNLVVVPGYDPVFLRTTFNNTGSVTLQKTPGLQSILYVATGTASGSFNIAADTTLQFSNYTLEAGATISGAGSTLLQPVDFTPQFVVAGDSTISTALKNSETLIVQAGATLTVQGAFINQNAPSSPAIVRLNGGTITSAQPLSFQSGSLIGSGTINGAVSSNSTISPGASAGTITINGALSLLNNSKIVMEIGGVNQGTQYDYLAIDGLVGLGGTLELRVINGFASSLNPKQSFTLLTSTELGGVFDNIANGQRLVTADGLASFKVNYGPGSPYGANNVVLSDPQIVPEPGSVVLFIGSALIFGFGRLRKQ